MMSFLVTAALCAVLVSAGDFGPQRFITTAAGTVEVGTCAGSVFRLTQADGKSIIARRRPLPCDIGPAPGFMCSRNPPVNDLPQLACTGAVFRRGAVGRLATRNAATGEVRVGFSTPRLTPGYGRLHHCSSSEAVYFMHAGYNFEQPDKYPLGICKLPHDLMSILPQAGHPDAVALEDAPTPALTRTLHGGNGVSHTLPTVLTSDTVATLAFDIACLSDKELYVYVLTAGTLVQYQHMSKPGVGVFAGAVHQSWDVVGQYKTDLQGPFWVVQVASKSFVAVDLRGRVVEFTRGPAGTTTQEVARSGSRVRITHDSGSASIVSGQYNLRVAPSGVNALVTTEVP